jgi:hypothetical protein
MADSWDAVVIGGGHNGLVAAGYLACRRAHAGVRVAPQDRRGGHHRRALAGGARDQGHPALLRDEPDAAEHRPRPRPRPPRLQGPPDGPLLSGLAGRALAAHPRRRRGPQPRRAGPVLQARRRRDAPLGRLARRARRRARAAAHADPAAARLAPPARPARHPPAGLALPRAGRPDDRRRDPADDHEHHRPARRLVRVRPGQGGLVGGNIFHGELSLEQLFHLRPAPGYADYRSPIAGLYQASSATHGGGGVCGIPGHHAVRAILADRRHRLRRRPAWS